MRFERFFQTFFLIVNSIKTTALDFIELNKLTLVHKKVLVLHIVGMTEKRAFVRRPSKQLMCRDSTCSRGAISASQ